jgi:hypothetical protein
MRENTEVPVPPQDESKPGNGLPNPDLNPMMNPTLGKNLGLWAQVYFTTPPEKREEAVQQLLRDLEKGVKPAPVQTPVPQGEAAAKTETKPTRVPQAEITQEGVLCPACLHRNDAKQHFCGLCGFTLQTKEAAAIPHVPPPNPARAPAEPVERNPDDWQWLHQKNRIELQTSKERTGPWRILSILLAALILTIAGYVFWTRHATGASQAAPASVNRGNPAPGTNAEPTKSEGPTPARGSEFNGTTEAATANSAVQNETEPKAEDTDKPETQTTDESVVPAESGRKELQMAHRYLDGRARLRNGQAAAFWLWKAVKKNNDEAVLLLSDLYVKGEGVPQSCDQARVLLSAAVKRGSSAAGSKLRDINASGCH